MMHRRLLLKAAASAGLIAGVGPAHRAWAQKKPFVFTSWGGALSALEKEVFMDPAAKEFGVEITNIGISVVTLLMVFVLQNTQNRDSAALHLKLDEVVRVEPEARDDVRGVESKSEEEIKELHVEEGDASDLEEARSGSS